RLDDGVFQARRFANVLARVYVNCDQGFSLVDHDVSAALEPDFRLERLVEFVLESELLEQWSFFGIELDSPDQRWLKAVGKAQNALVFLLGIYPDCRKIRRHLVTQNAFDHV